MGARAAGRAGSVGVRRVTARVTDASALIMAECAVTDLLPENGSDDPLGHFLRRIPAAHSLRENLTVVREHLAEADCLQPGAPERLRALAAAQVAADRVLAHEQPPFCADVIIDADVVLPARLAEEVEAPAS